MSKVTFSLILTLTLSFQCLLLKAQFEVEPSNEIPVYREMGTIYTNPWAGGLNSVHLSVFDADLDGEEDDIFLFEKSGNRTLVFIGNDENGELIYNYEPQLSQQFPPLSSFVLLRDYNCDGKDDIFTYSSSGGSIAVYENTSSAGTLTWSLSSQAILSLYEFSSSNSFITNIYCSSQDVPAIFDYDGDGDLDIMSFNVGGTFIEFHINLSVETEGICGLSNFELANRCYGGFVEGEESNDISLDPDEVAAECTFNVPDPRSGGLRHIGSTILANDMTGDGVVDLVLGDVGFENLTFLINSSPANEPDQIVDFSTIFPFSLGGDIASINSFPASFYQDVSGDGVSDLVVTTNNPVGAVNTESVHLFINEGEENEPQFSFIADDFLQNEMLDFGSESAPSVFDYNGDGLMDLVVGTRGNFIEEGIFEPRLILLINTGTSTEPEFTIEDSDWLNWSQGNNPVPTFGDIDADNDEDMMVGTGNGTVHLFENNPVDGIANFSYQGPVFADGELLDVGLRATPCIFDLNEDNLPDLVIGQNEGSLSYYENTGSAENPSFSLVSETLGGINTTTTPPFFEGNSSPYYYSFDGIRYLLVGGLSGNLFLYEIPQNINEPFPLLTNMAYGAITQVQTSPAGLNVKPLVYDWNGDTYPDFMAGLNSGGLLYFKGIGLTGIEDRIPESPFTIYPNPTDGIVFIKPTHNEIPEHLEISDITGRMLKSGRIDSYTIDLRDLPSGIYVFRITTASNKTIVEKVIKK